MANTARRTATYADLMALPEGVRAEIINGEIVTLPRPRARHSKTQRALGHFVGGPFDDEDGFDGPGGWWILIDVEIQFGDDVLGPDLSGWRRELLPDPDATRPIHVIPDWVCEIISPSNETHDRIKKRRLYARHGVRHYWIVDPEPHILEAFALHNESWVDVGSFDDDDTAARIPPFEAVEIPVGRLFLPRPPREGDR